MKMPFFRSRTREHDASSASTTSSKTQRHESPTANAADAEPKSQLGELQTFLARIGGFRGEARRLFPENVALDQMLGELRDECQRRVDYMARVSVQPAWVSPQKPQTSSSAATLGAAAEMPRRSRLFSVLPAGGQAKGRRDPTAVASSGNSSSIGGGNSDDDDSGHSSDSAGDWFERHQRTAPGRMRHSVVPAMPAVAASASSATQRGPHSADRRRKTAPQSMLLGGMPGDAASPPMNPRTSMADAPRLPSLRTSSIDMLARSPQLPIAGGGGGSSTPDMSRLAAITTPRSNAAVVAGGGRPQHMPATPSRGTEYLVAVRVAGSRIEAALSQSLQTSVISMQLATALNMPVARMPPNSRVWSSGGKSWQVVGEVAAMPFACGNMTFTHNFKVVPGAAAAHDLTRDMVLGNDFCVGNKGRIKDNRLHLEKLAMPVSVAVRPVPAS